MRCAAMASVRAQHRCPARKATADASSPLGRRTAPPLYAPDGSMIEAGTAFDTEHSVVAFHQPPA